MSSECEHVLVSFLCDSKLNVINISHFISRQSCEQNKLNGTKTALLIKKTLIVKSKKWENNMINFQSSSVFTQKPA